MALLVEALTQDLSGLGRRDAPTGVLMNVFLQVLDPDAFGGQAAFTAESSWLADACRNNPPRPGVERVRLPGEQALVRQRQAQAQGVPLAAEVVGALRSCLQAAGLAMPAPVG